MAKPTRFINPSSLSKPPSYTHVVQVAGRARIVFIAGQLGVDPAGQLVSEDFRSQAVQVFENLRLALAAVGATFEDVVKTTNFIVDMDFLPVLREVRASYMSPVNPPASTLVEVSALANPGALLEIEAIAAVEARTPGAGAAGGRAAKRAARAAAGGGAAKKAAGAGGRAAKKAAGAAAAATATAGARKAKTARTPEEKAAFRARVAARKAKRAAKKAKT